MHARCEIIAIPFLHQTCIFIYMEQNDSSMMFCELVLVCVCGGIMCRYSTVTTTGSIYEINVIPRFRVCVCGEMMGRCNTVVPTGERI